MNLSTKTKSGLLFTGILVIIGFIGFVVYDVLFSKPLILKGVIVEKIYVPAKNATGPHVLPYGKYRSYDHTITTEKHDQWIAFVKIDDGSVLKVNCHSNHYVVKQVGDTLHFKEYTGEVLGIDYFSHNEEDMELEADR
jgi:hypothetical protein